MTDHPAQHYLEVYQTRLSMAESGVTAPRPGIVAGMRQLVAGLSAMPLGAKVRMESQGGRVRFIAAETGELLGELTYDDVSA